MLSLAKPALDVGLYTDDWPAAEAFWTGRLRLPYEELLKLGGGVHQHRLTLRGGVLKVNVSREPLGREPTGYRGLVVADPAATAVLELRDPDGLPVTVVPPGTEDVTAVGVRVAAPDLDAYERFAVAGLGADRLARGRYRLGTTVLLVVEERDVAPAGALRAEGFRYLTVQVRDVRAEHERLLGLGATEGLPPTRLGEVAAISFVRDPGGNWLEVSQRASLTGPLPDRP